MMVFGGYTGILFSGAREFFLQLEKNKHEILGCPSLRAFLNLRFANESAGNEQRLRLSSR